MKLIDDLLDDESETTPTGAGQKKMKKPEVIDPEGEEPTGASHPIAKNDQTEHLDLELSDIVALPEDPPPKPPEDATLRLQESKLHINSVKLTEKIPSGPPPRSEPEVKQVVGRYAPLRAGGFSSATEASLATSENLRIAQNRILELEQELGRLRTSNEQLAAAGETLRRRADELFVQTSTLQERLTRTMETKEQEVEILRHAQLQKDKDVGAMRLKIEELEMRLSTNIQKIRVRERELENRLELIKMESSALVRNKDEIILDLKRQLDQINLELENYRNKGHELNKQINDKQEMLRRTVKALRIALSMLEGDDESAQKKAK
ncbi:MAG: hypothetical protein AB7K41_10340 [Bdellovibrionales bacterium]